jgi:inner membrane transporter RhtA
VEDLTWLRLVWASVILVAVARPWRFSFSRSTFFICVCLGVTSGAMTMLYMLSITRLSIGTATALEFLGPLSIAVIRLRGAGKLWALPPVAGVLALTEPWHGKSDLHGILLALAAGLCWAIYILLTQRAGDDVAGLHALAISLPVAAIVATFMVGTSVMSRIPLSTVFIGLAVSLLLPVIPYALELLALRRLTTGAFGILMSLHPAVGAVVGLIFLNQVLTPLALAGIALVVAAGIGATYSGTRTTPGAHAPHPAPGSRVGASPPEPNGIQAEAEVPGAR